MAGLAVILGACASLKPAPFSAEARSDASGALLSGPQATENLARHPQAPCWLTHPASGDNRGAIGVTETPSLGMPASRRARLRAVRQLTGYLGGPVALTNAERRAVAQVDGRRAATIELRNRSVRLQGFFEGDGRLFAYASLGGDGADASLYEPCPQKARIQPAQCRPRWLCAPVRDNQAGFMGVSYRAMTAARQYELAVKNALSLLEYAYGVKVQGSERYFKRANGVGTLRFRSASFDVSDKQAVPEEITAYVRELRYTQGRLYLWLVAPELPAYAAPSGREWLQSPTHNGIAGAVGTAKRTGDGLLSTQIGYAVDDGVFRLAKAKGIEVTSEEQLKRSDVGEYYIRSVATETRARVRARVLGLFLDDSDRVHVWVAPAGAVSQRASPESSTQKEKEHDS